MDINRIVPLFGGEAEIVLYDVDQTLAKMLLEDIYQEALRLQKIFNLYDKTSELSNLNDKRELNVSEDLLIVLEQAIDFSNKTNGRYDVSKGHEILSRKQGLVGNYVSCSYKDIRINNRKVTLTNTDVLIDLGSIAKGYIVDKLVEYMKKQGIEGGFVDARGDMATFGELAETIEIQHPRKKDKTLLSLAIKDKAVATSGDYNQFYESYDTCHIIGKKEIVSATVVANTLAQADVIATCICLLDKDSSKEFLLQFEDVGAVMVDSNLDKILFNMKHYEILEEVKYANG